MSETKKPSLSEIRDGVARELAKPGQPPAPPKRELLSKGPAYPIPAELHAALMTERGQLLAPLIANVAAGRRVPSPEEVAGILCLVKDLIADRVLVRFQLDRMTHVVDALDEFHSGLGKKVGELGDLVRDAKDARETPPVESAREAKLRARTENQDQDD